MHCVITNILKIPQSCMSSHCSYSYVQYTVPGNTRFRKVNEIALEMSYFFLNRKKIIQYAYIFRAEKMFAE